MTGHVSAEQSANSLPLSWQRLLALSGVAFAVLFLVGPVLLIRWLWMRGRLQLGLEA